MSLANEFKQPLRAEYEGADLGDQRRTRRLVEMAETIAKQPDASIPTLFPEPAGREGAYRFLRNEQVTPEAIWGPHRHNTAARAAKAGAVLVVHDTSAVDFGNKPRAGLGKIKRGKRYGFYMHTSLVIAADDDRLPLGVVGLETYHRTGKRKKAKRKKGHGRPTRRQKQLDPTNEGRRWLRGIDHAAVVLADTPVVIHVMDSEADAYPLLATLVDRNQRFVIRNCHDRCVVDATHTKLQPVLEAAPQLPGTREIALNRREGSTHPTYRTSHPPRAARTATVAVSAVSVTIPRSESSNLCPHQAVSLNLVRVFEPTPPAGELAVEWKLWTTEPIDTPEQVWAIVDIYRSRWVIEEYFTVLKTGCALEARQFESEANLLRVLALFIPIAWWLLALRTLCRVDPQRPAQALLSPLRCRCLRAALRTIKVTLPEAPTVRDVLLGIARLGGHIPRNGEPGWIVLLRGLEKLLLLEEGYRLALRKRVPPD